MVETAGLLIIYKKKIVLAHPVKYSSKFGTYSIPKGHLEEGETHLEAAIRETKEEVGIEIPIEMIDKTPHEIDYYDKNGELFKKLTYFIVRLKKKLPIKKLQLIEIDTAGYLDINESKIRINDKFEEMLEYIK